MNLRQWGRRMVKTLEVNSNDEKAHEGSYANLDAIVVIGSMVMLTGIIYGFFTVKDLPDAVLPVLASLATAILGLPVAYGAFRWGNNVGARRAAEAAASSNRASTDVLSKVLDKTGIVEKSE